MGNIVHKFIKDGIANCPTCKKVVDIQQGQTIRLLRSSWLRMNVEGRCGHKWLIANDGVRITTQPTA